MNYMASKGNCLSHDHLDTVLYMILHRSCVFPQESSLETLCKSINSAVASSLWSYSKCLLSFVSYSATGYCWILGVGGIDGFLQHLGFGRRLKGRTYQAEMTRGTLMGKNVHPWL